jgi:hypothetical protein
MQVQDVLSPEIYRMLTVGAQAKGAGGGSSASGVSGTTRSAAARKPKGSEEGALVGGEEEEKMRRKVEKAMEDLHEFCDTNGSWTSDWVVQVRKRGRERREVGEGPFPGPGPCLQSLWLMAGWGEQV